jgi:glycosyltransferase involved in cell wall biosynthesis
MRVAYVLSHHARLSQTFIRNEASELVRQGVEVRVLAINPGDTDPPPDQPTTYLFDAYGARDRTARDHAWWALRHPVRYARFLAAVRAMAPELHTAYERPRSAWKRLPSAARDLRAWGADVLLAHFAWQGAAAAYALSRLMGVPWVLTVHARDMFADQRHLGEKLRAADRVVTVCEYNRRWLAEHFPDVRDVDVVICGVTEPAGEEPVTGADVVAVGRLVAKKGFDTLVRAAALLPGTTVEVIGEGRLRAELEALIAETGADVTLTGALDHDETLRRVAGARVLCLPARVAPDGDRDSMPVVVKEAMIRGVPVVASDEVAIPEMVDPGTGRLVPPDDHEALAAALREVLSDPELARCLGVNGRVKARERFLLSSEVAKLHALLRRVSGGRA